MKLLNLMAAFAAVAGVAACGGGGDPSGAAAGTGTLSIALTDNPCDHRAVHVTIEKLRVHRSGDAADSDAGWRDLALSLPADRRRVDLLTLQNGLMLPLGDASLETGSYTQLRLVLAQNTASTPLANSVTLANGTTVPLTTPSAQRSGVKLIHPFTVEPDQIVELTLDFDACKSIVRAGNSGQYHLKPTIAVVPMLDVGRIAGFARPGARVSAQIAAAGRSPVVVKSTTAASNGAFALAPLPLPAPDATYTVVVSAADVASAVIKGVPVTRQNTTVVSNAIADLPADQSQVSRMDGTVLPAGLDGAAARALQRIDSTGVEVEVAAVNADATTGAFTLTVPRNAPRVATHPAPTTGTPATAFPAFGDSAGKYVVEAVAGTLSKRSAQITLTAPLYDGPDLTLP